MLTHDEFYQNLSDNKDNYLLIQNFLSKSDLATCLNVCKNLQHTDADEFYDAELVDPAAAFGADHFFAKIDITKIAQAYGLTHVDHYQWEVARDDPEWCNDFHNDVKHNKNTITLQWYLDMDDPERKLHISNDRSIDFDEWKTSSNVEELDTIANSMIAFLAQPNTFHGFRSGRGLRYNVRLRIVEKLNVNNRIHHFNPTNDVCWFIDSKDMEIEDIAGSQDFYDDGGMLEDYLARFTYETLIVENQSNIIVNNEIRQYPRTLESLKDAGFKKCVIAMAGACITSQTVNAVYNNTDEFPVYGQPYDDHKSFLRRLLVINLDQVDINLADGFEKYMSNFFENSNHVNIQDYFKSYYIHPESSTFLALTSFAKYKILDNYNYVGMSDHDQETLRKIIDYYRDEIYSKYPEVKANTLTLATE